MTNETGHNEVELCGMAASQPILSHENHGVQFYRFLLRIPRLSGQVDTLPVLLPSSLLVQVVPDVMLHVCGQLRSFNNKSGIGSRLVLTVYAMTIEPVAADPLNRILLSGTLCKPPVLRRTPLGRSICDLMLAVPRRYGRADYLPVITWGQLAISVSRRSVGDPLSVEGRVQSRQYTKVTDDGPQEHTAYEVSVMHLLEAPGTLEPDHPVL